MKGIVFEKLCGEWIRLTGLYHKWQVEEMVEHYKHPFRWIATEEEAIIFKEHYLEKGILVC